MSKFGIDTTTDKGIPVEEVKTMGSSALGKVGDYIGSLYEQYQAGSKESSGGQQAFHASQYPEGSPEHTALVQQAQQDYNEAATVEQPTVGWESKPNQSFTENAKDFFTSAKNIPEALARGLPEAIDFLQGDLTKANFGHMYKSDSYKTTTDNILTILGKDFDKRDVASNLQTGLHGSSYLTDLLTKNPLANLAVGSVSDGVVSGGHQALFNFGTGQALMDGVFSSAAKGATASGYVRSLGAGASTVADKTLGVRTQGDGAYAFMDKLQDSNPYTGFDDVVKFEGAELSGKISESKEGLRNADIAEVDNIIGELGSTDIDSLLTANKGVLPTRPGMPNKYKLLKDIKANGPDAVKAKLEQDALDQSNTDVGALDLLLQNNFTLDSATLDKKIKVPEIMDDGSLGYATTTVGDYIGRSKKGKGVDVVSEKVVSKAPVVGTMRNRGIRKDKFKMDKLVGDFSTSLDTIKTKLPEYGDVITETQFVLGDYIDGKGTLPQGFAKLDMELTNQGFPSIRAQINELRKAKSLQSNIKESNVVGGKTISAGVGATAGGLTAGPIGAAIGGVGGALAPAAVGVALGAPVGAVGKVVKSSRDMKSKQKIAKSGLESKIIEAKRALEMLEADMTLQQGAHKAREKRLKHKELRDKLAKLEDALKLTNPIVIQESTETAK